MVVGSIDIAFMVVSRIDAVIKPRSRTLVISLGACRASQLSRQCPHGGALDLVVLQLPRHRHAVFGEFVSRSFGR